MLAIKTSLNMGEEQWLKFYAMTALVSLTVVIAINLASNFIFTKKLNILGPLLADPKRVDEFILENQKILDSMKRKNPYRIALVKLNLSAAYCRKKDYEKAKLELEEIAPDSVKGANKAVYFINKSYTYFKLGMNEKAVAILKEGEKSISSMEYHVVLGGNIAALKVIEACTQGDKDKAKMLYGIAKNKWSKVLNKEDYDSLEEMIGKLPEKNKDETNEQK